MYSVGVINKLLLVFESDVDVDSDSVIDEVAPVIPVASVRTLIQSDSPGCTKTPQCPKKTPE